MKKIFISYSWKNNKLVNEIEKMDSYFSLSGIKLFRDTRHIEYMDNTEDFMDKIESSDYVIVFLSKEYFYSLNCMYEFMKIWNEIESESRIMLIKESNFDFNNFILQEAILEFWKKTKTKIKNSNEYISLINEIEMFLEKNVTKIGKIRIEQLENIVIKKYKPIFDFIGFHQSEIYDEMISIMRKNEFEIQEFEAEKFYIKYTDSKYAFLLRGILAMQERKDKIAELLFKEVIKRDIQFVEAYVNLGSILSDYSERLNEAEELLLKALKLEPSSAVCCFNYARLLEKLKKYELARDHYLNAIKLKPDFDVAYFHLAVLTESISLDSVKAEEYYQKAIEINNSDTRYYYYLADLMEKDKKIDESFKLYQEALVSNPHDADTYYLFADFIVRNNLLINFSPEYYYKMALKLDQNNSLAHSSYSLFLYEKMKRKRLAKKHYLIATQINPSIVSDDMDSIFNIRRS